VPLLQGMVGLIGLMLAPTLVPTPPAAAGPWHQLGAAVTSRSGKALHFYRTSQSPHALSVVVTSGSSRPVRLFWWSYCEFQSDDDVFEEHQATVSGIGSVTVYPPVFAGATQCYVAVNATPPANARVSAAVFDS
jgi:hypothetical protein